MSQGVYEKRREIEDLKVQLGLSIESEDFEKAAEIRDRIKELENEPEDISS
jgi:protein arginine kinase activator